VRWGRLILAPARWCCDRSELRALEAPEPASRWRAVQAWREQRRLPRWVCLVEGDNKLAIDLDNALSVDTFIRAVRGHEETVIEELYPRPEDLVAVAPDGRRAVELVVPLVRTTRSREPAAGPDPARSHPDPVSVPAPRVRRMFPPGSEWTYLKLYTGSATADRLLREQIGPLADRLIASGAAKQWFFIRFTDPRPHLRVRLCGDPGAIREAVEQVAGSALEAGLAHDAEFATYQRELERYGGPHAIALAERLFHADSDAVVALLDMFEPGARGLEERWRIGVLGADVLLCDLGLDIGVRAAHARNMQIAFERELRPDARLRRAVAARVRSNADAVDALLAAIDDPHHPLASGITVVAERSARIRPLTIELSRLRDHGRLEVPLPALATAFVHMWLNRLCRSENRLHEYVSYAMLARVLTARTARAAAR
jgi:thiopeptide-type bacteriocin biosynthesis protein